MSTNRTGPTRIVILGGSYAALNVAKRLEKRMPADGSVQVTLISRENYLLFTTMLPEVAAGELAPDHIAVPLRRLLRRTRILRGDIIGVDLQRHTVATRYRATGQSLEVPYDHLVIALGSVTSYHHVPGAEEHSLTFKSLEDATRARARIIDNFEQANLERDPAARKALLTIIVAGGGNTGVELAASLQDFLRSIQRSYPRLAGERPTVMLVHHGERLLEQLDPSLAADALRLLRRRGMDVRLATGVAAVSADGVTLDPGGMAPAKMVFWTAGIAPNPFVEALPVPKDHHGAVIVDNHLAVQDHPGVWALGDDAGVPNPAGGTYAPTAQNAENEGPVVADNILATIRGEPLRTVEYKTKGMITSLGHRRAVAQVFGRRISGLPAWMFWRAAYLSMLPGLDRKARVGMDWLLDSVFPPDIVGTLGEPSAQSGGNSTTAAQAAAQAKPDVAGATSSNESSSSAPD
ncbi:MAG: NAD(P)/FAD-dependent oxidoreductase [Dehalococcoidia bacterium]